MTRNLKNIFHKLDALFHKAGALRIVFFAALLFSGISLFAHPTEHPAEHSFPRSGNAYSGLLTVNRDCEAPALRYRLGQQLQLNFRSARPGQSWNLQRTGHLEGKLLMSNETKHYISCVSAVLFIFKKLSIQRTFFDDGNCLYLLSNMVTLCVY